MCAAAATDPDTQTLNTVYKRWGSPGQLASWDSASGKTACNMTGINCNAQANVVSLSLYNIPTGAFDPLLFTLTSLSSISLINAHLVGSVSPQISRLTRLEMFQTSNNFLTGSLPPSMSLLVSLTTVDMNTNQLTGPIPQQLSTLVILSEMQLADNRLSGVLPSSLSSLSALVYFYAPSNLMTGPIPAQYSALQRLTMLSLSSNLLTSTIPWQLTSLTNLTLSVTGNLRMCGLPLTFGVQVRTNIGPECPPSKGESTKLSNRYVTFSHCCEYLLER